MKYYKKIETLSFKKQIGIILSTFFLIVLVPLFIAGFFVVPSVDDYFESTCSIKEGYINRQIEHYVSWNGRYTSTAIQSAPFLINFSVYRIIPFILFISFITSFYYFLSFPSFKFSNIEKIFISLFILSVYFVFMMIPSNFFWLSASATYFLPIILSFYVGRIIFDEFLDLKKNKFLNFLFLFAIFIIVGCSEIAMMWINEVLVLSIITYFLFKKNISKILSFGLLISIISSLIVILSPGNHNRMEYFPEGNNLFNAFFGAIKQSISSFNEWFFDDIGILLFLLSFIYFIIKLIDFKESRILRILSNDVYISICLFFSLSTLFILFFVPFWSLGSGGPERTIAFIQFIFIINVLSMSFILATSFLRLFSERKFWHKRYLEKIFIVFLCVFLVKSFLISHNIFNLYGDLLSLKLSNFYNANVDYGDCVNNRNQGCNIYIPEEPKITSFDGKKNFEFLKVFVESKNN